MSGMQRVRRPTMERLGAAQHRDTMLCVAFMVRVQHTHAPPPLLVCLLIVNQDTQQGNG